MENKIILKKTYDENRNLYYKSIFNYFYLSQVIKIQLIIDEKITDEICYCNNLNCIECKKRFLYGKLL